MYLMFIAAFVIMSLVQISLFMSLPKVLRHFLSCVPLLAVIINFILSGILLAFTGIGMIVGVSNLGASIVFGIYITHYQRKYNTSCGWEWRRKFIFSYPVLVVRENGKPVGMLDSDKNEDENI